MAFEILYRAIRNIDPEKLDEDDATELGTILEHLSGIQLQIRDLETRALEIAIMAMRDHKPCDYKM